MPTSQDSLLFGDLPFKGDWTLVFVLARLLTRSGCFIDQAVPVWAVLTLVSGLLGLILAGAFAVQVAARRLGLQASVWRSMGPGGLFLPRETQFLPKLSRVRLALVAPGIYLSAGLVTLPYLVQAGGLEGLVAVWDWWTWPMIAARFSFMVLVLAAIQMLPFYPLSGGYLLQSIVGNLRFVCRLSQVMSIVVVGLSWQTVPLVLPLAVYCLIEAEIEVRRTHASEPLEPHLLTS